MKMIRLAAALAAMIGLVSCEEVLDSVITEPTFSVFSTIYDGQTCKLVKISACTYAWETDSPSEAVVAETGKKKRAWLTVNLSDKTRCKSIAITARNANDATVEPFTVSTMVHPWKLVIFKKDGDKWTECGTSYDFKGTGGVSIEVRMVALQTNGSWKEVDKIPYEGSDGQELNWEVASSTGNIPTAKMGATKLSFDYSTLFQSFTVSASLGEETRTVSFFDSTY